MRKKTIIFNFVNYDYLFIDHIEAMKNDIECLEDKLLNLEKEKEESINQLNILTKFFKEQEKEYVRYVLYFC